MGMGMGSIMFLIGILRLVIIGLLVYELVKWLTENKHDSNDKAMKILKERFARGEITSEEYEREKRSRIQIKCDSGSISGHFTIIGDAT